MTKKMTVKAGDDPVKYCIEKMKANGTAREISIGNKAADEWDDLQNACMEATGHSFKWRDAFEQWLGEGGERAALGDFFNGWSLAREEHKAIDRRWPLIRGIITDTVLDQLPSLSSRITEKAMKELKRAVHALDDACAHEPIIAEIAEATDGTYKQLMLNLPMPKGTKTNEPTAD